MKGKGKEPTAPTIDSQGTLTSGKEILHLHPNTNSEEKQAYMREANEGRRHMIMFKLKGRQMTAREIAYELGFYERNATAPRLTELEQRGLVTVVGTRIDPVTKIRVRVYARSDE